MTEGGGIGSLSPIGDNNEISNISTSTKRCYDMALEGERCCRAGDTRAGVAFLEEALKAGTDDLRLLSAIYSQLGNAYFYLHNYTKAVEYHKHDLTLARTIGDRLGEAKASGNLGSTLKQLTKFEEAIACCRRHYDISLEMGDKVGVGRALYNLANVYHAKGKHMMRNHTVTMANVPDEVKDTLVNNLSLVKALGDIAAEGRACGNLGNTFYLLQDFPKAIHYHKRRLQIAKEYGDKHGMRRAYTNMGNAHVFLGEFEAAIEYYRLALTLAIELTDQATEAQTYYSLGNCFTLLGDHEQAAENHLLHLPIARRLNDRVGQARATWSLGNAYTSMGSYQRAQYFVALHLTTSMQIADVNGVAVARSNLDDLERMVGADSEPDSSADPDPQPLPRDLNALRSVTDDQLLDLDSTLTTTTNDHSPLKLHSGNEYQGVACAAAATTRPTVMRSVDQVHVSFSPRSGSSEGLRRKEPPDEDSFMDQLWRSQSKRMDDQRCDSRALSEQNKENRPRVAPPSNQSDFIDFIADIQSRRMNDQRATLPYLPGLQNPAQVLAPHILDRRQRDPQQGDDLVPLVVAGGDSRGGGNNIAEQQQQQQHANGTNSNENEAAAGDARRPSACSMPDDDFFEMLLRCQNTRINEQRSELPARSDSVTVPEDDFFNQLILKMQQGRLDEQRAPFQQQSGGDEIAEDGNDAENSSKLLPLQPVDKGGPYKRTASEKMKQKQTAGAGGGMTSNSVSSNSVTSNVSSNTSLHDGGAGGSASTDR